ncbi:HWE histidine kinase domain-containing protein [Bradyrhizobium neotropicale]|uniref:HWE histidine kinase domain-containing protein n=1 Tax=Bradyrhizobium neotropicale TaxID=1497615 RepID=UPI00289C62EF|nr:HWE histidine kinase domain-containing protein [Bradyrhizobium neotropicale]
MKKLLGIVRSLASQMDVEGRSAKEYRDAFLGRFQAVAKAENLALASSDQADLNTLIEQALEPAGAERYRIVPGPPVGLKQPQVLPISLIPA